MFGLKKYKKKGEKKKGEEGKKKGEKNEFFYHPNNKNETDQPNMS